MKSAESIASPNTQKSLFSGHDTTWAQKISFFMLCMGNQIYYLLVGSYFNTYMLTQGIPLTVIAFVFLIAKVWDAVNDPLFAFIFDKIKFTGKRKEKCLPWIRISGIILPLVSIAMFNIPGELSVTGKTIWFFVTYVLWDMSFTIADVPRWAINTTMAVEQDERNFLFNWGSVFAGAGTLFGTTIFTLMIGETFNTTFGIAAVAVTILALVCEIPIMFFGKEKYAEMYQGKDTANQEKFTLKQMFTYLAKNKYLTMMYIGQLLRNTFAIGATGGAIITFYVYGSVDWTIASTWISMIGGPVMGLLLPFFLKKFDRFKMYMFCLIWVTACSLLNFSSFYLGFLSIPFALTMAAISGFPDITSQMLANSFTMDALEYGRYKTGIDGTGINFAFFTFASKIPSAFNGTLSALATAATTFVIYEVDKISDLENLPQPEGAIAQVWSIQLMGIICSVLMIAVLLCFYKLRSKDVDLMAQYNAGKITREECDAKLSRKY